MMGKREKRKRAAGRPKSGISPGFSGNGLEALRYETPAQESERAAKAIQLIDEWLREDSDYDEKTWPALKKALERNRLSARRLFND